MIERTHKVVAELKLPKVPNHIFTSITGVYVGGNLHLVYVVGYQAVGVVAKHCLGIYSY
jgi:hypothetical protein